MSGLAVAGRILGALAVAALVTAWVLFAVCLAVVYASPLIDALTGGFTP